MNNEIQHRQPSIGLGYIGLPTAAADRQPGHRRSSASTSTAVRRRPWLGRDPHRGARISTALVQKVVAERLPAPRPTHAGAGRRLHDRGADARSTTRTEPDLDYVIAAARSASPACSRPGNLVILESTMSRSARPRRCATGFSQLSAPISASAASNGPEPDIAVAYCPERVLPGRILTELVNNDRCIGGITADCAPKARRFYETFVRGDCIATDGADGGDGQADRERLPRHQHRLRQRAVDDLRSLGINVWEVIDTRQPASARQHPEAGSGRRRPLHRGRSLVHRRCGTGCREPHPHLARGQRREAAPHARPGGGADRGQPGCRDRLPGASTFKANVDDLRESPALTIATELARRYGSRIKVVEPHLPGMPDALAATGACFVPLAEALATCEVAVLLVDHDQFKAVPADALAHMTVLDTRGILARGAFERIDFPGRRDFGRRGADRSGGPANVRSVPITAGRRPNASRAERLQHSGPSAPTGRSFAPSGSRRPARSAPRHRR